MKSLWTGTVENLNLAYYSFIMQVRKDYSADCCQKKVPYWGFWLQNDKIFNHVYVCQNASSFSKVCKLQLLIADKQINPKVFMHVYCNDTK